MPPRINLPPLTRALLLTNLLLSFINASIRLSRWTTRLNTTPSSTSHVSFQPSTYLSDRSLAVRYLALVVPYSIRFPWTFLTAALVENNLVSLAVSASVLWFGGRYLERAWGMSEFGKFVLFVAMIPNLLTFGVYGVWYGMVGQPEFPAPLQGLVALEAGFLVALKQLVPEHTVSLFRGALRIRIKHFPALFTLANIISGPLLGTDTAFWLSLFGFLTGWIYLRFFRITEISSANAEDGEVTTMKGDASDTFAFVAFFPDALHPILSPICDAIHNTLVVLKVIRPFSEEAIEAGNENAAARSEGLPGLMEGGRGPGGGRRAEAERRRAIALRALDQRLNAAAASRAANAPVASNAAPTLSGDTPALSTEGGAESASVVKEAQA